ncbi:hypothetical protein NIES2101_39260 [Calothrix sp. HK-06]|nr:hypothetical protein NIES2101_39260 [Calothrix sp. HK-06]
MRIQDFIQSLLGQAPKPVLLFDSVEKANDIAFMLKGKWDGCNGVAIYPCDEVAVNTAASLLETSWCYQGDAKAVIESLKPLELKTSYARGERIFINANLRCAELVGADFSEANFSCAKLDCANLSEANLSKATLTGASATEINLKQANLSDSQLIRTNLKLANLEGADLRGANLTHVCLEGANLTGADFRGAKLHYTNLINCNLTDAVFDQI